MPPGSQHFKRLGRFPLHYSCPFEMIEPLGEQLVVTHQGEALSINISARGMLLLMDQAPEPRQKLKVQVPTPLKMINTPTRAEVRWTRQIPIEEDVSRYLVGVRFLVRPSSS